MSDISLRISELILEKKMNKRSFSAIVGYSDVAIGKIISGKSKPKFEMLESLINTFPDINPTWLLTGEGEMLLTGEEKTISEIEGCKQCKELKKENDLLKQIIEAKNETIKALQNKDSNESSKR